MREIKFRAWDIPNKKMWLVKDISFRFDYREDLQGPVAGISVQTNDGDDILLNYELMQYTGLKDKNGKEIFEGDIVIVRDSGFGYEYIGVINWDEESLSYELGISREYPTMFAGKRNIIGTLKYHTFEVIGNIYENSGLLKGGEDK